MKLIKLLFISLMMSSIAYADVYPFAPETNVGMNSPFFRPVTSGQGFQFNFIDGLQDGASPYLFVAWYTYHPDPVDLNRNELLWVTAGGNIDPTQTYHELTIYLQDDGEFNDPSVASNSIPIGVLEIYFDTCNEAYVAWDMLYYDSPYWKGDIDLIGGEDNKMITSVNINPDTGYPLCENCWEDDFGNIILNPNPEDNPPICLDLYDQQNGYAAASTMSLSSSSKKAKPQQSSAQMSKAQWTEAQRLRHSRTLQERQERIARVHKKHKENEKLVNKTNIKINKRPKPQQ